MSRFPLYDTLIYNTPDRDLTILQKNELIKRITSLDQEAHELIYALIKSYYIEHSSRDLAMPYNGQLQKERIVFNLIDLPNRLRQLLYKFTDAHNKKLIEDQAIHSSSRL